MARRADQRRRRTEQEWQAILDHFDASGLSVREYCVREGVSASSLQRWKRQLGASASKFVELAASSAASPPTAETWTLELELPSGVRFRLRG